MPGWSMHHRPNGQLVRDALAMAIHGRNRPRNTLVHSHQGCQYMAAEYQADLTTQMMTSSRSRMGKCHDNAVAESVSLTLKNKLVHEVNFKDRNEARQAIFKYIELFYKRKRRHSYLNHAAPLQYEKMNACA
jgi:putative transposase